MISVVIPLYNKEHQIAKTLQSVFAQTYTDYEIVIVNDGSTDNSVEVVEKINNPRIRMINQQNAGVSAARNKGIEEAKGEYIALLDADDEWKPEYLETIAKMIRKYPECDVFTTRYDFKDEFGNRHDNFINGLKFPYEDGVLDNYFNIASISDAPLWTSAVVASKKALCYIGGFPEGVTSGEDLLTWAKLACNFKIAYSKKISATYYTPTTGPTGIVPVDLESINDYVGTHLEKLHHDFPDKKINEYIAYWYKMRGVINIRRSNRWASLKCALKSIKYNPRMVKSWVLIGLSASPHFLIKKIFKK